MRGERRGSIEQWDLVRSTNGYLPELDINLMPAIVFNLIWATIFKGNVKMPEKSVKMLKT